MDTNLNTTPDLNASIVEQMLRNTDGWIASNVIERSLGITGTEVRRIIHQLRTSSVPIVSSRNGYRYTEDTQEIMSCVSSLKSRASYINEASVGLAKFLNTGAIDTTTPMEPPSDKSTRPELDRMLSVSKQSQMCGEFLDWLSHEKGYTLCSTVEGYCAFQPVYYDMNRLLAEFFDIDLDKVEEERRAILDSLRYLDVNTEDVKNAEVSQ